MGEVWAARNELTQKSFAIKFLLPALAERPDALERFIREAETAGGLDHPAIVNVFDVAQAEDGRPFIVMELLAGESLAARLARTGPLTSLEASAFLAQIAEGLEVAHRAGVVHRDLSAANIFLARNPEGGRPIAKILDFGVSKTLGPTASDRTETGNGAVLGCPEFMSPEQARGAETVDVRTDVWSIGVVLYQCITGTSPFRAKNYNALMAAILTEPHRPVVEVAPAIDAELAVLIEGCLAKERDTRVQSAREVADRLGAIARRLAGPSELEGAPRRRATDRLRRAAKDASPRAMVALGVEELRALSRLRPRRSVVGVVSAVVGVGVGASLALMLGSTPALPVTPAAPLLAPIAAMSAPAPSPAVPLAAKLPERRPGEAPRDLAVAVARGLGVGPRAAGRR
jgi:serine/threonine-protein kinase